MSQERENRPGTASQAALKSSADGCESNNVARQLRARRAASRRLPRLECCACRDPWPCRCHDPVEPSEQSANGYSDAAQHLLALGLLPAPNVPAMRMLWRRGGDERSLVGRISERWEVA